MMNMHVQVFGWTYFFNFLRYIPKSKIARSHGNCVLYFLKSCQTFHSGCIILPSHQQHTGVPVPPYLLRHLFLSVFLMTASSLVWGHPTGVPAGVGASVRLASSLVWGRPGWCGGVCLASSLVWGRPCWCGGIHLASWLVWGHPVGW